MLDQTISGVNTSEDHDQLEQCADCGDLCNPEYLDRTNPDGERICSDCYEGNDYSYCEQCDNTVQVSDTVWIEGKEIIVCTSCAERNFMQCDDCGKWFSYDDVRSIDSPDCHVCERCYDYNNYFYCEDCGQNFSDNYYGEDGLCEYCSSQRDNDSRIHEYSYRPRYRFNKSSEGKDDNTEKPLYFGIELEVEVSEGYISEGCDSVEELPYLYMKKDGSINNGFEIVSHPGTLNFWQEQKDSFEYLLESLRKIGDAESQGLHVHISKNGMDDQHKIRFQSFFDANNKLLPIIARRGECSWSRYKALSRGKWRKATDQEGDRYRAVNWFPCSTVEIRMFRGTLKIDEFMYSLEFCHAAYQFTKNHVSIASIASGNSWKLFCAFIARYAKNYPALVQYLKADEGVFNYARYSAKPSKADKKNNNKPNTLNK